MPVIVDQSVIRRAQRLNAEHQLGLTIGQVNRLVRSAMYRGADPDQLDQWFVPLAHRDPTGELATDRTYWRRSA